MTLRSSGGPASDAKAGCANYGAVLIWRARAAWAHDWISDPKPAADVRSAPWRELYRQWRNTCEKFRARFGRCGAFGLAQVRRAPPQAPPAENTAEKQRVRQQMLARNWRDDAISSELGSFCQKSHLIAGLIDLS